MGFISRNNCSFNKTTFSHGLEIIQQFQDVPVVQQDVLTCILVFFLGIYAANPHLQKVNCIPISSQEQYGCHITSNRKLWQGSREIRIQIIFIHVQIGKLLSETVKPPRRWLTQSEGTKQRKASSPCGGNQSQREYSKLALPSKIKTN